MDREPADAGVDPPPDLTAIRFDNWKMVFLEQRAPGTLRVTHGHPGAGPCDHRPPAHRTVAGLRRARATPQERQSLDSGGEGGRPRR
jgi:hypothetical protein